MNKIIVSLMKFYSRHIHKRRIYNLCESCPDNIKGTCCYYSEPIMTPYIMMCERCPEHIRNICTFPKSEVKEKGIQYNIILPNHPCKYLNTHVNLCSVYKNRFNKHPYCLNIAKAIKMGVLLKDCIYVKHKRRYKEGKNPIKVFYDDVKDKICEYGKITFDLSNRSAHKYIAKY